MKGMMLFLAAQVLLFTSGAMGQDVRYNFDKDANFSQFKTYQWVDIKGAQQPGAIVDKDIKQSVDAQLAAKGLTQVTENADLIIGYQVAVGTEKQFTSYNTGWGYGPGWGGGWYGPGGGMTTGQTSTIYNGTLGLDMYEASKKDLVWRGTVTKSIDPDAKPEKQQKNLDKSVKKLLKDFPPEAKEH
jgi:Domain of unknown function (DUF4136)